MTDSPHLPAPARRRPAVPVPRTGAGPSSPARRPSPVVEVPEAERAFFVEEFRGSTVVVALPDPTEAGVAALRRSVRTFAAGDTRVVVVVPDGPAADRVAAAIEPGPSSHGDRGPLRAPRRWGERELAALWVAVQDRPALVLDAGPARAGEDGPAATTVRVAGEVAAGLRAGKVMLTDAGGGLGEPARSFVELRRSRDALAAELTGRGSPVLLEAAERALRGGAFSVNLCRPEDLEIELFTFDGAGTLVTLGGYTALSELRVDDLPAVEALVAQGVADGILRPRSREDTARIAVTGLGARLRSTGHLAGIVGLETAPYEGTGLGEVSGLITVSQFSGAGTGGMLVDGLLERARERGLAAVFAVTVSEDAAAFFHRRGFREVSRDEVPAAKWAGYAPERLDRTRCYRRELTYPAAGVAAP